MDGFYDRLEAKSKDRAPTAEAWISFFLIFSLFDQTLVGADMGLWAAPVKDPDTWTLCRRVSQQMDRQRRRLDRVCFWVSVFHFFWRTNHFWDTGCDSKPLFPHSALSPLHLLLTLLELNWWDHRQTSRLHHLHHFTFCCYNYTPLLTALSPLSWCTLFFFYLRPFCTFRPIIFIFVGAGESENDELCTFYCCQSLGAALNKQKPDFCAKL